MWLYSPDVHVSLGMRKKAKFNLVPLTLFYFYIFWHNHLISSHRCGFIHLRKKRGTYVFLVNIYISCCITHPCSFMSLYQTDFSTVSLYSLFSHGSCSADRRFSLSPSPSIIPTSTLNCSNILDVLFTLLSFSRYVEIKCTSAAAIDDFTQYERLSYLYDHYRKAK
jgi:hypothetical protein